MMCSFMCSPAVDSFVGLIVHLALEVGWHEKMCLPSEDVDM
jgi:hypothetical protein